jgi:hypothetical protein
VGSPAKSPQDLAKIAAPSACAAEFRQLIAEQILPGRSCPVIRVIVE